MCDRNAESSNHTIPTGAGAIYGLRDFDIAKKPDEESKHSEDCIDPHGTNRLPEQLGRTESGKNAQPRQHRPTNEEKQ